MILTTTAPLLDHPVALTDKQIAAFQRDGFIKLKQVMQPEELAYWREVLGRIVREEAAQRGLYEGPIEQRSYYNQVFLQVMNLWLRHAELLPLVFSRRLARLATELLGCAGVRLYHDQALYKEPGGGLTPWHSDQVYWPLDNERSITAWIPLHAVDLAMGPLEFCAGSQRLLEGRQHKISEDSEGLIGEQVRLNKLPHVVEPYELGEVSFHYGYTFHRAGANTSEQMREVMTIIYMDKDSRMDSNGHDDGDGFCSGISQGERIDSWMNPVLYER